MGTGLFLLPAHQIINLDFWCEIINVLGIIIVIHDLERFREVQALAFYLEKNRKKALALFVYNLSPSLAAHAQKHTVRSAHDRATFPAMC